MTGRIIDGNDPAAIEEAAAILRRGGLVAVPTETVYGLGARALDEEALLRVFAAKGRPSSHPLIAHVLDLDGARAVASEVDVARPLAEAFWPGPLSLILPRSPSAPAALSGGLPTVAVRAPAHPIVRALIAALREPIAAPSANRYQGVSPTTAQHVADALGDRVELILDGGPCERGIESTVVDLTGPPRILRLGPIDEAQLRALLPGISVADDKLASEAPRASPGMDARHYAPRADLRRFSGTPDLEPGDAVIFCGPGARLPPGVRHLELPRDPLAYGARLYAALHALDVGHPRIWIEDVPDGPEWAAIRDRIARGSAS